MNIEKIGIIIYINKYIYKGGFYMSFFVGGWLKFRVVEEEDLKVFNEVVGMLEGVGYELFIVFI